MKTTIPKLRRIIRKVIQEHAKEPIDGYVQDGADMYAQDEDYDGYIKFGKKFGYTEDQLEEWFIAAEDAIYQAQSAAYEPELVNVAKMDIDQLERDFESGYIDLEKRPYQLD